MSADQFAGSLLCVASIAFIAITTAYTAITRTANRDQAMRDEFAGLYRDQAEHDLWVKTGLTDYQPGDTPVFEQMCVERWDKQVDG